MPMPNAVRSWPSLVCRSVVYVLFCIVGYSIGLNWEKSNGQLKRSNDDAKQKLRDQLKEERDERQKLKVAGQSERKKAGRLSSALATLINSLEIERTSCLPISSAFSHRVIPGKNWVSMAAWGDDGFFICDYSNVYYLDTENWSVRMIPKPKIDSPWVPTGLSCVQEEKAVLVANYFGHNVLEFRLVDERLELQCSYECAGMKSPEGVAVSRDGRLVGVADYDGNRLWVFRRGGPLLWQREIGLGHGVAFGLDSVYVTSLLDKSVSQFSLDGSVIRRVGGKGWGSTGFLWPTSVFVDDRGVIVSDAHTGKITLLKHDLSEIKSFGGNGPAMGLFNMPYCTIRSQNKYWICDTLKQRILHFTPDTGIEQQFSAAPPDSTASNTDAPAIIRWGYTDISHPVNGAPPQFPKGLVFPDYGGFMQMDPVSGVLRKLNIQVDVSSIWSPKMFTYFTWMRPVKRGDVTLLAIGSVSHPGIFFVHPDGRCTLEHKTGSPLQNGEGGVYDLTGAEFNLVPAADAAMKKFNEHDDLLGTSNTRPVEAARSAFWPDIQPEEFTRRVAGAFLSETGKQFWASFSTAKLPSEEVEAAAKFDAEIEQLTDTINLTELWLRRILVPKPQQER